MNRKQICLVICLGISLLCTIVLMVIVHFLPWIFATLQYDIGSLVVRCELGRFLWHRSETCDSSTPQDALDMDKGTLSKAVSDVTDTLLHLKDKFITFPSSQMDRDAVKPAFSITHLTDEVLSEELFGSKNTWKALPVSCTLSTVFTFLGCYPAFYLIMYKKCLRYRNIYATLGCILMLASSVCMLIPVFLITNKTQHLVDSTQQYEENFRDLLQISHTKLVFKNPNGIILAVVGAFFAAINANIFIIFICKKKPMTNHSRHLKNRRDVKRNGLEPAGYDRFRLPATSTDECAHPSSSIYSSNFPNIDRTSTHNQNEREPTYQYIDIS